MNNNDNDNNTDGLSSSYPRYEAPSVQPLGTLAELTRGTQTTGTDVAATSV